ncbi:MAG: thiamine phosphate synthase [Sulfuritalea sp.]|nr:thiamine phosphate synthase [Sulfuritalea sp.]
MLATLEARPALPLVAASCHTPAELERAAQLGCDFAVFGPVRATASHSGAIGLGWQNFAAALAVPPLPTFALGGMSRADLDAAQRAGAHGIAAIRAAWGNLGSYSD